MFVRRYFGLHVDHDLLLRSEVVQGLEDVGLGLLQSLDDALVVKNILLGVDDGQHLQRMHQIKAEAVVWWLNMCLETKRSWVRVLPGVCLFFSLSTISILSLTRVDEFDFP